MSNNFTSSFKLLFKDILIRCLVFIGINFFLSQINLFLSNIINDIRKTCENLIKKNIINFFKSTNNFQLAKI